MAAIDSPMKVGSWVHHNMVGRKVLEPKTVGESWGIYKGVQRPVEDAAAALYLELEVACICKDVMVVA